MISLGALEISHEAKSRRWLVSLYHLKGNPSSISELAFEISVVMLQLDILTSLFCHYKCKILIKNEPLPVVNKSDEPQINKSLMPGLALKMP